MAEQQSQPFQLSFNPSWKVDFQDSRVTSDGGLLLVRELDECLGLSTVIAENIINDRRGAKSHSVTAPGSAAAVHLQPLGRIRRCERCRTAVARPAFPLDRLG